MTPEKISLQTDFYRRQLRGIGIPAVRMDITRTFASLDIPERLAHAHYLCEGIPEFVLDLGKIGKANRHFASMQAFLGFSGLYTLEDLMKHNRP